MRGTVIAVTSGRSGIAKRGVSAALAVALRAGGYGSTCVVDIDVAARDVAKRFTVSGPSFGELARVMRNERPDDVLDLLGHDPATDIWVVPAGTSAATLDSGAYLEVLDALRARVDWLIVDAPAGLATASRPVDRIIDLVDVLVTATSVDPVDLSSTIASARIVTRQQSLGILPTSLRTQLVIAAGANELDAHRLTLQRKLRGMGDVAMLPRLWGRDAVSPIDGDGVSAPFAALLHRIAVPAQPQPA
jgi:septum formation inhibitor-activating ATPase MinD